MMRKLLPALFLIAACGSDPTGPAGPATSDTGVRPADAGRRCSDDSDCRTFSDYCTGCDCRALTNEQDDPVCPGPGVMCFADPCMNKEAVCTAGKCTIVDVPPPVAG